MRDGIDDESYGQIFKPVSITISKSKWRGTLLAQLGPVTLDLGVMS